MTSMKIKPCPFCGSEEVIETGVGFRTFVHCANCDTDGPSYYPAGHDQRSAIDKWNERTHK